MTTRKSIPKPIRDSVLREFNHRCAICGADRPHIHHIDENPSNNNPENLLPLCPNCHLTDHHDPTKVPEPLKLKLLRLYKDPTVLLPEFHPIYSRLVFLEDVSEDCDAEDCNEKSRELADFISNFQMGNFYSKRIVILLTNPGFAGSYVRGDPASMGRYRQDLELSKRKYCQKLMANRSDAYQLVVEMLRYQHWGH